jgi:hypothetical protein
MPRSASGSLGRTAKQRKWLTKHAADGPESPLNGRFDDSDTNALLDEAAPNGDLELEPGSTNVVRGSAVASAS